MAHRPVIEIDEDKCTGCGECVVACAEGAIEIIDGKARLVSEVYCDGLGACLGECPEGALILKEREAEDFDEEAVQERLANLWSRGESTGILQIQEEKHREAPAGCPSAQMMAFKRAAPSGAEEAGPVGSVGHWPLKLRLVPPEAPFLQNAEVMLVADCVPFVWTGLHRQLASEGAVLIGCPKFDDYGFALERLTGILRDSQVRSLTVVHMEVPCCTGYWRLAQEACVAAGSTIPLRQVIIGVRGEVKQAEEAFTVPVQVE